MRIYIGLAVAALALSACTKPTSPFAPSSTNSPSARPGDLGQKVTPPPPPKPVVTTPTISPSSPEYFRKSVGDRVLFDVDQYTLNAGGKAVLDGQIRWLKDNPTYTVVIEGHADEQGTREYNIALGARRAQAVRDYMVAGGIDPARVRTLSFGKERPIEICSEENCYSKNRRAVSVLAGGIS